MIFYNGVDQKSSLTNSFTLYSPHSGPEGAVPPGQAHDEDPLFMILQEERNGDGRRLPVLEY